MGADTTNEAIPEGLFNTGNKASVHPATENWGTQAGVLPMVPSPYRIMAVLSTPC